MSSVARYWPWGVKQFTVFSLYMHIRRSGSKANDVICNHLRRATQLFAEPDDLLEMVDVVIHLAHGLRS